jgi:AAA domain
VRDVAGANGGRIFEPEIPKETFNLPALVNGLEIRRENIHLPPAIIHGLLCRGEKAMIAGGSKSSKTFALIDQALSCAAGVEWWGFKTEITPVIYLNLEIPKPFFEQRVLEIAAARKIAVPDNFNVWHLRGAKLYVPARWDDFILRLETAVLSFRHPMITADPIYKLLGGKNENAAGDVQALLEQLEEIVQAVEGANSFGHHYSKGNQSQKEAIDRGSGSGVFQRDPDTLLPMTRHEKQDAFVIEPTVRNHPPINPFVIEWSYPLFTRNADLDPQALKTPKKPGPQTEFGAERLRTILAGDELSSAELRKRAMDETGMSKSTFYNLLAEAETKKLIIKDGITKKWERFGTR